MGVTVNTCTGCHQRITYMGWKDEVDGAPYCSAACARNHCHYCGLTIKAGTITDVKTGWSYCCQSCQDHELVEGWTIAELRALATHMKLL